MYIGILFSISFQITFDNKAHSGRVKIHLDNKVDIQECKDPSVYGKGTTGVRGGEQHYTNTGPLFKVILTSAV